MSQMRTSEPDECQLMFLVFDLLDQDDVDLRGLPLTERKRDLHGLCVKARVPFLNQVQTFPNGPQSSHLPPTKTWRRRPRRRHEEISKVTSYAP